MSATLAAEFVKAGHEVRLITATTGEGLAEFPFPILRKPSRRTLWEAAKWCDVFFHNNISFSFAWPLLVCSRPWVVAHHTWISRPDRTISLLDRVKLFSLRFATNVAISRAIGALLPVRSTVIGNPYAADTFREMPGIQRERELVFVGRLVSDKGADVLLHALALLAGPGLCPRLTIVGSGPEDSALRQLTGQLGLSAQVTFAGVKQGEALATELNAHRVLVVPSRWEEPFGIVALEGLACGCVVVGSSAGGLSDAIGRCGLTVPNGDATALAGALQRVLTEEALGQQLRSRVPEHLAEHRPARVARRYLEVFESVTK